MIFQKKLYATSISMQTAIFPLLHQTFIYRLLNPRPYIQPHQLVIPHIRIGAVAQKDINQAVLRVCPGASTRETGMTVDRSRGRLCAGTLLGITPVGLIKSQPPAAYP